MPGYATMVALDTGFTLSPLTVARKTVADRPPRAARGSRRGPLSPSSRRIAVRRLAIAAGLASLWVFRTVLRHRDGIAGFVAGAGIAVFVAAMIAAACVCATTACAAAPRASVSVSPPASAASVRVDRLLRSRASPSRRRAAR